MKQGSRLVLLAFGAGLVVASAFGATARADEAQAKESENAKTAEMKTEAAKPEKAAAPKKVVADQAPETNFDAVGVAGLLKDKGYTKVSINDSDGPVYAFDACKKGKHYTLKADNMGEIVSTKEKGLCGAGKKVTGLTPTPKKRVRRTDVDAPYTTVRRDGTTHVDAPHANVKVSKKRIRIKAPFVDLDIRR